MYVTVPVVDGVPETGDARIIMAYSYNGQIAYCNLDTKMMLPNWSVINDAEIIKRLTPCKGAAEAPSPQDLQGQLLAMLLMEIAELKAQIGGAA